MDEGIKHAISQMVSTPAYQIVREHYLHEKIKDMLLLTDDLDVKMTDKDFKILCLAKKMAAEKLLSIVNEMDSLIKVDSSSGEDWSGE